MSNPLKIVIAPDKFRGSLTAKQAAQAMARGVLLAAPGATVDLVPMADGGEGTVEALVEAAGGEIREIDARGPMGRPVKARFGLLDGGSTAVVEMAQASGLALVPHPMRDPVRATTFGTGELLLAAIAAGARRVIMGIGGSATNDAGAGFGQALGFRLLDAGGLELEPGGGALGKLAGIDRASARPELGGLEIIVACDVDNPLCGDNGATRVFGPQKGVTPATAPMLDHNLAHFASIVERDLGVSIRDLKGAGAAGGLGGGLVAFAGARLMRGVEIVMDAARLRERLGSADLCLTGEGKLDSQSAQGKTISGVGGLARSLGVPTFAMAGKIEPGAFEVLGDCITAAFALCDGPMTVSESIDWAAELLEQSVAQAVRAFLAGRGARPSNSTPGSG